MCGGGVKRGIIGDMEGETEMQSPTSKDRKQQEGVR
ncbi:hypothetical protein EVA_18530 [gut metagenome]|uniref:Uncharacterized protein n=1 Tax=gut metagenome TaxID=749906 RepID=J9G195_9ZZZZ